MNHHLTNLIERFPSLHDCATEIERVFSLLADCYRAGNKVLICGNGGSAADAEHWSAELMKGFYHTRPLSGAIAGKLPPDIASNLQGALPTIPLTGFPSFATAFANDNDSEYLFAQLVMALGKPGDVLIAISTSGNSRNILHAVRTATARGVKTVGLTGREGGRLVDLADVSIRVPATEVHLIQEYHMPVYHTLSLMLEEEFFGSSG
ncbi:SIS domain-containing protein [Candidatus Latescibacterota bacterium]